MTIEWKAGVSELRLPENPSEGMTFSITAVDKAWVIKRVADDRRLLEHMKESRMMWEHQIRINDGTIKQYRYFGFSLAVAIAMGGASILTLILRH